NFPSLHDALPISGRIQLCVEFCRFELEGTVRVQADDADARQRVLPVGHQDVAGERVDVLQPDTGLGRDDDVYLIDSVDGNPDQLEILCAVIVQDPEFI